MSTQAQINASVQQYVLYYMHVGQSDTGVYPVDLSTVCTLGFNENTEVVCSDWTIGTYGAPSNATLLTFGPADVLTWYDGYYANPTAVAALQHMSLTADKIAALRTSSPPILTGYIIYNSTTQKQQRWSGAAWVDMW